MFEMSAFQTAMSVVLKNIWVYVAIVQIVDINLIVKGVSNDDKIGWRCGKKG